MVCQKVETVTKRGQIGVKVEVRQKHGELQFDGALQSSRAATPTSISPRIRLRFDTSFNSQTVDAE